MNLNMQNSEKRSAGQTLTEVMLAAIFLATGGLVIYAASANMMKGEAWKAERIFAQGALRDMVEVFSAFDYCELQKAIDPGSKLGITDNEDATVEKALANDALQASMEADNSPLTALKFESFFPMGHVGATGEETKPIVKTKAEMLADPVYKAYHDTKARLDLRRAVLFKDEGLTRAIVTCVVRFKATSGQPVTLKMPFVVFKLEAGVACP